MENLKNINKEGLLKTENVSQFVTDYNQIISETIENEIKKNFKDESFINLLLYVPKARKGYGAVRPFSSLLGYVFGGNDFDEKIIKLGAAVEILNSSITYIDDNIFDSDLYVGKQLSLHYKHDLPNAMIVSSTLRAFANKLITDVFGDKINEQVLKTLYAIPLECDYGQYLDVSFGYWRTAHVSDSEKINKLRTGQFIRRCAELGYLLADNYSEDDFGSLQQAYELFGFAAQDANDFDDINFTENSPGAHGNDIRLFKKTKPIVRTLDLLTGEDKENFIKLLGNPAATDEQIEKCRDIIVTSGALQWALENIIGSFSRATETIGKSNNPDKIFILKYFDEVKERYISFRK